MTIFNLFTLFGGLALFLFGMQIMGDGLQRLSGSKLEQILERLASTPVRGVLLGAGVTAVIQASAATTVMVVGFVNAGIMQLRQAVGIIMGANLGTTVTAWILSLAGIEGSSFITQMFKPTSFAPILGLLGLLLYLFAKNGKTKDIGSIFLGFMMLMYGMSFMSDAVAPLAQNKAFVDLLVTFSNPALGLLVGALLTAIMQSSSASVGVLQAIAISGALPFAAAVPIIMGQNIGTCVTAMISSIGTSTNAKRAAFIHLYFNVLGSIVFLVLFYTIYALYPFEFMLGSITAPQIALVHTVFNVVATAILLPFARQLEWLACFTVKSREIPAEEIDPVRIPEERFLTTPGFAVEHCRLMISEMSHLVYDNIMDVVFLCGKFDEGVYDRVVEREKNVAEYGQRISDYILKVNHADLSERDTTEVAIMRDVVNSMERIGELSTNVSDYVKECIAGGDYFSRWGRAELAVFTSAIIDVCMRSFSSFRNHDIEKAKTVQPLEEVIDQMRDELKQRHIRRLQTGECTVRLGLYFLDILNDFERISDYCAYIAAYIINNTEENFDMDEYWKHISEEDRKNFRRMYHDLKNQYPLPEESEKALQSAAQRESQESV